MSVRALAQLREEQTQLSKRMDTITIRLNTLSTKVDRNRSDNTTFLDALLRQVAENLAAEVARVNARLEKLEGQS